MRHPAATVFSFCIAVAGCALAADSGDGRQAEGAPQSAAGAGETETPGLRMRIAGKLIMTEPVGGIVAIDLHSLQITVMRPSNAGRVAVHGISEPDDTGRAIFVTENKGQGRSYAVHVTDGNNERPLFTGPGDPLWDHAISPVSLAPRGGKVAFVAQPLENEGKQFKPLVKGPLRIWDPETAAVRDLGAIAAGERPSWFPDGRHLAYATAAGAVAGTELPEPVVHLRDTISEEDNVLAPGHLPLVSSDGKSVLLARGRSFDLVLVDVATRAEQKIARVHGIGTPITVIDSRYLIFKGRTTPGAPTGTTTNNSPLVGVKTMLAVKLMDLRTNEFETIVPLIDPRRAVTALAHEIGAATK